MSKDILGVSVDSLDWNYRKLAESPMYKDRFLTWVKDAKLDTSPEKYQKFTKRVIFDSFYEDGTIRLIVDGDLVNLNCIEDGNQHYVGLKIPSHWYDKPAYHLAIEDAKEGIAYALSRYCSNKERDIEKMCQRW